MWMQGPHGSPEGDLARSTMAKVFEIRLLHLWECRHGAEEREAARQASLRELLALEDKEQAKASKKGIQAAQGTAEQTNGTKAKAASAELLAAETGAEEARKPVKLKGDLDDIDMEFKQRVLEHLRIRAEEAKAASAELLAAETGAEEARKPVKLKEVEQGPLYQAEGKQG
ncbi:hypothetical protein AK812_SmicGene27447 [Symbiodinium microadriaticum]|uniref:Uncharacterized protein n=1 Tax=Symbiodinium microadriaticum TaxID=2951 RepID=A0A1Q9D6U1_SYMMI|nr:hypothetical protein AK812_SmicGene27447 [Symbiodinium microadriaticum]